MYSSLVLDHFNNPRNVGEIPEADVIVEASNPVCGDLMKLWAVVREGRVVEVRFKVAGCVPAVACASWLTEWMKMGSLRELSGLTSNQLISSLGGLPPASSHAAVLAIDALKLLLVKGKDVRH